MTIEIEPIATIFTPYKEKFAIPRQPGLVPSAVGKITFHGDYADPNCVRGLEQYSHIWLTFVFHATRNHGWSPLVRPPRLGGNRKMGVFATRSTFRPNHIGQSVVTLKQVSTNNGCPVLWVTGMDLLDGTPVIDIKPYLPYVDSVPQASAGFATAAPQAGFSTQFAPALLPTLSRIKQVYPDFEQLVSEILAQDPRPAYKHGTTEQRIYGVRLYDYDVRWQVQGKINTVIAINALDNE